MRLNSKRPSGRGRIERYGIDDMGGYSLAISPVSPDDISVIMQNVTGHLRERLQGVEITSPLILSHGDILERAVTELAYTVNDSSSTPETNKQAALRELQSMASVTEALLSGRVPLRRTPFRRRVCHEGYPSDITGETWRVVLDNQPDDILGDGGRVQTRANTQLTLRELQGMTRRGRAIGSNNDGYWRMGLRYGGPDVNHWVISIDAGQKDSENNRWLRIYPLSQVIQGLKMAGELAQNNGENPFTFHYMTGAMTDPNVRLYAKERFLEFNWGLGRIIESFSA